MSITDEQLLSLPFDELAALCADADERTLVAMRLGDLATPSFPAQPGSLAHAFATEIERRMIAWVQHCAPFRESEYACAALRAFGEAIAKVARAVLIGRVSAGRRVDVDMDGDSENWLALSVYWNGATISRYTTERPGFGRIVATYHGEPDEFAVEAVARLIEEASR